MELKGPVSMHCKVIKHNLFHNNVTDSFLQYKNLNPEGYAAREAEETQVLTELKSQAAPT